MTIDTLIMLAGAFVAVLPFLGFPNSWDTALFFLAGVFIISLGIVVRRRGGNLISPLPKKDASALAGNPPAVPAQAGKHDEVV